jgi:CRP-like cAMP-binding protein
MLAKRNKVAALSRLALFEECSQRDLGQIASLAVESRRPAGSILTREGQPGRVMFVVLEGEAEVLRGDRKIQKLRPGDVVGELSLIDGRPRSATVRAVSDVHLLELAGDDFLSVVDRSPRLARNLLRSLSQRLRQMNARWPAEF